MADKDKEEIIPVSPDASQEWEDEIEIVAEDALQDKLKTLRNDLKICHNEKAEYLAGWQRAKADFINARKDEEKARAEFVKFATERVLGEILKVADSLEKISGVDGKTVLQQLSDILKKEGITAIEAKDKIFNPLYHEALEQLETNDEKKDGMVLEEMQKGYMIHNRVLRPAKVKVGIYKN